MPVWKIFIKNVMNVDNYEQVFYIIIISLVFYVIFAFNNIIDSIFYGIGKTNYMLFQSMIVNIIFYGTSFFIYLFNIYVPTLTSIALMFGIGTAIDSLITFMMFKWFIRKNKIEIIKL